MTWRVAAAMVLAVVAAPMAATPAATGPMTLRAAFAADMFTDVRVVDAMAAIRIWAGDVSRRGGFGDVGVEVLADGEAIVAAVAEGRVDLVCLRAPVFLEIRSRLHMTPVLVSNFAGQAEVRGLLVAHGSNGWTGLDALRGQDLVIVENTLTAPAELWLETAVMKRGYPGLEAFFGRVRRVSKASQAVLPVFFRQAKVALVDEPSFRVIGELNPQVAKDVAVIEAAPAVLPALMGIRDTYDPQRRADLIRALSLMGDEPRGQQLLTLFRSRALQPYRPELMTGIEQLVAEHARLKSPTGARREPLAGKSGQR